MITEPSPDGMALIRSIMNPVGHTTGKADITIPITTINCGEINVPVYLEYESSGVKIQTRPGAMGMSWSLVAGGRITRLVKGQPDETTGGWKDEESTVVGKLFSNNSRYKYFDGSYDSQPDIYFFEFPASRGIFMSDGSGGFHTIPYQNLKISGSSNEFQIMDEDGTMYFFSGSLNEATKERTDARSPDDNYNLGSYDNFHYVSTWHLEAIIDLQGNLVEFGYTKSNSPQIEHGRKSYVYSFNSSSDLNSNEREIYTTNLTQVCDLTRISWKGGTILTEREPETTEVNRIVGLIFSDAFGEQYKRLTFNYTTFSNNRKFLTGIKEQYTGGPAVQKFSFDYYRTHDLPARTSTAYDAWGYFNGKTYSNHRPAYGSFVGADRTPVLAYAKANTLIGITDEWGGKKEYDYELHTYLDGIPKVAGGLRIKSIKETMPGKTFTTVEYEYFLPNASIPSGIIKNPVTFGLAKSEVNGAEKSYYVSSHSVEHLYDISEVPVSYGCVTETYPLQGKTRYEYSTAAEDGKKYGYYYLTKNGAIELVLSDTYHADARQYDDHSRFWQYSLLKKVTRMTSGGTVFGSTDYTYVKSAVKKSIKSYIPLYGSALTVSNPVSSKYTVYTWESRPNHIASVVENKGMYDLEKTTRYGYSSYETLSQTQELPSGIITKISYTHDLPLTPLLRSLFTRRIYRPVQIIKYNGTNEVIGGQITDYKDGIGNYGMAPTKVFTLQTTATITDLTSLSATSGELSPDSRFRLTEETEDYDDTAQWLTKRFTGGRLSSVIYGYNNSRVIAEITGAVSSLDPTRNQVFHTSFEDAANKVFTSKAKSGNHVISGTYSIDLRKLAPASYRLTYWRSVDSGTTWDEVHESLSVTSSSTTKSIGGSFWVDELRITPVMARMKTFTYNAAGSITSLTDPLGHTTYYEYDGRNRVARVLNNERKPVEKFDYHFVTEQ